MNVVPKEAGPRHGSPSRETSFFARAIALVVLVFGLNLWSSHHLGIGLENPGWIAGLVAAVSGAVALVEKLLGEPVGDQIQSRFRSFVRSALSPAVLVVLYLLALILMLTTSSVMVIAEAPGAQAEVTVTALDDPDQTWRGQVGAEDDLTRFFVLTTPFGRPFRVGAAGYVPAAFDVHPLVGRKVLLGTDLPISPSVLFRPPALSLGYLEDGGTFRVLIKAGSEKPVAEISGERSSFLLGRRHPIPSSWLEDWRLELLSDFGDDPEMDPLMAKTLLQWKRPTHLESKASLGPGSTLIAEVWTKANKIASRAEVTLGMERLIDVPMRGVRER